MKPQMYCGSWRCEDCTAQMNQKMCDFALAVERHVNRDRDFIVEFHLTAEVN